MCGVVAVACHVAIQALSAATIDRAIAAHGHGERDTLRAAYDLLVSSGVRELPIVDGERA